MNAVLLDTGPIVALLDRSERYHQACAECLSAVNDPFITCEAVLAEACYLLRGLKGAPQAILRNVDRGVFLLPYRVAGNAAGIPRLMTKYAIRPMGFADACLLSMADAFETARVLTLDSDFRFYRWGRNRTFKLLIDLD